MAVVKKKKISPDAASAKAQIEAEQKLADYAKKMRSHGNRARKILAKQDLKTREAAEEIISALSQMSDPSGTATISTSYGDVTLAVQQEVFEDGWAWVTVRLLESAHEWDIRVANFKPIKISKKAGAR